MGKKRISRSNINAVICSCKEARHIALEKLDLGYFLIRTETKGCIDIPDAVRGYYSPGHGMTDFRSWDKIFPIRTLVIDARSWYNPDPYCFPEDGILEFLLDYQVQELLIVAGDTFNRTPQTVFVRLSPHARGGFRNDYLGGHDIDYLGVKWSREDYNHDNVLLADIEDGIDTAMHEFQDRREYDRMELCEFYGLDEDELDAPEFDCEEDLRSFSNWKIPSVRFVEARPVGESWIWL